MFNSNNKLAKRYTESSLQNVGTDSMGHYIWGNFTQFRSTMWPKLCAINEYDLMVGEIMMCLSSKYKRPMPIEHMKLYNFLIDKSTLVGFYNSRETGQLVDASTMYHDGTNCKFTTVCKMYNSSKYYITADSHRKIRIMEYLLDQHKNIAIKSDLRNIPSLTYDALCCMMSYVDIPTLRESLYVSKTFNRCAERELRFRPTKLRKPTKAKPYSDTPVSCKHLILKTNTSVKLDGRTPTVLDLTFQTGKHQPQKFSNLRGITCLKLTGFIHVDTEKAVHEKSIINEIAKNNTIVKLYINNVNNDIFIDSPLIKTVKSISYNSYNNLDISMFTSLKSISAQYLDISENMPKFDRIDCRFNLRSVLAPVIIKCCTFIVPSCIWKVKVIADTVVINSFSSRKALDLCEYNTIVFNRLSEKVVKMWKVPDGVTVRIL